MCNLPERFLTSRHNIPFIRDYPYLNFIGQTEDFKTGTSNVLTGRVTHVIADVPLAPNPLAVGSKICLGYLHPDPEYAVPWSKVWRTQLVLHKDVPNKLPSGHLLLCAYHWTKRMKPPHTARQRRRCSQYCDQFHEIETVEFQVKSWTSHNRSHHSLVNPASIQHR